MNIDAEFLLARLPAFYRERDEALGGPLRALLAVLAEQGDLLENDIAALYDNWFIETCDDWLIPYIGDLLGVRGLSSGGGEQVFRLRAQVANTLALRRRKGTVPVLEQLAYDWTGWHARAVEFFQLLGTSQYLNHLRPHNLRTPNLRDALAMERIDGPFDRAAHTGEVRPLSAGRYNIANIGLYLWRLQAYALASADARPAAGAPGRYHIDALGRGPAESAGTTEGVLYNRARAEEEITQLAQPIHVPEPLSRLALYSELRAARQSIADGHQPVSDYFYNPGSEAVLRLWLDDVEVPAENLVPCNLALLDKAAPADPDDWWRPPASTQVKPTAGGPAVTFPRQPGAFLVAFDPLLGRIALPAGKTAGRVQVSYLYGFPGDIGGGPYDRRSLPHDADAPAPQYDHRWCVPEDKPSLQAALNDLLPGTRTLIQLNGNFSESLAPVLNLPDLHLTIEARNECRPVLQGDWSLQGNANTRLALTGIALDGALKLKGPLGALDIHHCSLVPSKGGISHTNGGATLLMHLSYSLCGPVRVTKAIAGVRARNCLIDNGDGLAFDLTDTPLHLERCTVLGGTKAGELLASDSLFTDKLTIARKQEGCVRFSYVPADSQTPRRHRCQPDLAVGTLQGTLAKKERIRVTPAFTSVQFGHPAYGQLRLTTAAEIRTGADDGAEMGVWNLLQQPQREANLRQALDEYLRFGLEAGVIFVN